MIANGALPELVTVIVASFDSPTLTSPSDKDPLILMTLVVVGGGGDELAPAEGDVGELEPPLQAALVTKIRNNEAIRITMTSFPRIASQHYSSASFTCVERSGALSE